MDNLIELIGEQFSPDVVSALSGLSGATPTQTQSALGAAIPGLVGALANQGSTPSGAQQIMDLVGSQAGGENLLGNVMSMLGGGSASESLLSSGTGILGSLMAGNTDKIVDVIASVAGIENKTAKSLLRAVAPMAIAFLGKMVKDRNMDSRSLSNLLAGQTDFVKAAAPQGLIDAMGFTAPSVSTPAPRVAPPPPPPPAPATTQNWLWWAIAIVIVLILLWFFFLRGEPEAVQGFSAEMLDSLVTTALSLG